MTRSYRRRADGVEVSADHVSVVGLSVDQREREFEELDAQGRIILTRYEQLLADVRRGREQEAQDKEERERNMRTDAARRPPASKLSRDQLLVDIGRAIHAAFPDRADDLMQEVERRMPHERFQVVEWDDEAREWKMPAGWDDA